jgi:transcriptional regulator GlxA family with amidase domain
VDEPRGCRGIVFNVLDSALPQEMETASVARRVLRRLCERAFEGQNAVRLSDAGQRTLGELFEQMAGENQRQAAGHTAAISIAYQSALLTILRDPQTAPWFQEDVRPSSAEDRLVNLLRYLEHHAADELSVEEMARMACMSRSHFHACFRETTGYAPLEYVNRLRIRTAERLLRETDRSIAEIAHGCGFPSLSHFYHLFGRVVGRTPRQARLATT